VDIANQGAPFERRSQLKSTLAVLQSPRLGLCLSGLHAAPNPKSEFRDSVFKGNLVVKFGDRASKRSRSFAQIEATRERILPAPGAPYRARASHTVIGSRCASPRKASCEDS
jgi:hypothetical protein